MQSRVQRIFQLLAPEKQVDAIVLMMGVEPHLDQSFFYATDLVAGGLFERGAAILWPDGGCEVVTSVLEEASARKVSDITLEVYNTNSERDAYLRERLAGVGRVGVNKSEVTLQSFETLRSVAREDAAFVDVGDAVMRARLVKDAKELARMQRAADIASAVADRIPDWLAAGMKEYELAAQIVYEMQKRGASGPSFSTIVGFGANSAEPHYHPGDVPLRASEFVLCDFGAYVEHYASDITRTLVHGRARPEHREMYETVLAAHAAALDAVRPGAKGGDVHNAAAAVIDASRFKGRFIHSVGHSLGLAVHDGAVLNPRQDLTLEEGMVLTIEPGVYVPDVGGVRIEDDIVVTRNGYRLLTSAKRDFVEVG